MKEGELNKSGCNNFGLCLGAIIVVSIIIESVTKIPFLQIAVAIVGIIVLIWIISKSTKQEGKTKIKENPLGVWIRTTRGGEIKINNPFRGVFVVGAAGSGKSESVAIPLLQQFINKDFSGLVYDFKFPSLAKEVESFLAAKNGRIRHFCLNFNNPSASHRVNPLNPAYLPNTSYAREYAQAIISNLLKESIAKPDFWTRSATDLLTACIWFLREERPDICDIPHVFAMITSSSESLLNTLQSNPETAQMTISIYDAMKKGADSQVSGILGTLQGAIAQINTPELMYIFSGDDFSLDLNNPENPIILTVGSFPTLTRTFAPLCSLVITVATKIMNQENKHHSFVLLDECPTCFIPNLDILPNTGRSNKIATILMCQDLAQFTESYGKDIANVLFASCNNHFYGRVGSGSTAEILSKQFGKIDKVYTTSGESSQDFTIGKSSSSKSETIQERELIKASEFLKLEVGEFAGILVESDRHYFRAKIKQVQREITPLATETKDINYKEYYKIVRNEIKNLLAGEEGEAAPEPEPEPEPLNILKGLLKKP